MRFIAYWVYLGCPSQARNKLDLINSIINDLKNTASRAACRTVSAIVGIFGLRLLTPNDTSIRESADQPLDLRNNR